MEIIAELCIYCICVLNFLCRAYGVGYARTHAFVSIYTCALVSASLCNYTAITIVGGGFLCSTRRFYFFFGVGYNKQW